MIRKFVSQAVTDFNLPGFNDFILKFVHLAAFYTDHVIMVFTTIQFEYRISTFEMVAFNKSGSLELCEYSINGGQTNFFAFFKQILVDFFGGQVPFGQLSVFQDFQDFYTR